MLIKKSTARELPVILTDSSDFITGLTGKVFGNVTCKFRKNGETSWTVKSITAGNWHEIGNGHYTIDFLTGDLNTAGLFEYIVIVTGSLDYSGLFEVRTNTIDDIATAIVALVILVNAIDTSTESAARFTEIKGAGWTDETLKALKEVVDAFTTENFNMSPE